ncbi:hypothetical protein B0H19DRAFT_1272176 [Mycena capillaripes]|nr:hypothetical protein B0H19DRAFT_1272176 [Mycena capillaripes]
MPHPPHYTHRFFRPTPFPDKANAPPRPATPTGSFAQPWWASGPPSDKPHAPPALPPQICPPRPAAPVAPYYLDFSRNCTAPSVFHPALCSVLPATPVPHSPLFAAPIALPPALAPPTVSGICPVPNLARLSLLPCHVPPTRSPQPEYLIVLLAFCILRLPCLSKSGERGPTFRPDGESTSAPCDRDGYNLLVASLPPLWEERAADD